MSLTMKNQENEKHIATVHQESIGSEEQHVVQLTSDVAVDTLRTKEERAVVRKLDMVLLPLMALTLFVGYLDRGNIGNARVLGLQKDLNITSQQYFNCVMMFYVGYMIIELPAGMVLRYVHPRYVFSTALVSFGVFAACMASVKGYGAIMGLRVLIGLGEAVANNAYIFVSLWYKPNELALRLGAIYCMTPVAGAVTGVIAYAVGKDLPDAHGIVAWKWLFIIEGVLTIGFGIVVLCLVPGLPEVVAEKGSWLFRAEGERQTILRRYKSSQNSLHAKFRASQLKIALMDPKLYLGSLMVAAQGIGIGAFSVFLPTFILEFGFSALETQLYSMIPYAFGLVCLIVFSYLSDHFKTRALMNLICLSISCTGFIVLLATTNKVALVAGACFVAAGAYPALVISTAWVLAVHGGYTKRAMAVWFVQIFVQSYSIITSQVYRNPPRFFLGHSLALALYFVAVLATIGLYFVCKRANKAKEQARLAYEAEGKQSPETDEDFERLCDFHPSYVYIL